MPAPAGIAAGLIVTATVLLTGCGGGAANGGSSAAVPAPAARAAAGKVAAGLPAAGPVPGAHAAGTGAARRDSAGRPARLASARQNIVYTASMTVRVRDVSRGAALAAKIASQASGYVSQENVAPRPRRDGGGTASIQLKIPVPAYPGTLGALAGLGKQLSLRQQAQDVTQQVADTTSRAASDQAAITQLRALLSRAGSVGALLAVQDQINVQESDLEAMLAQQRALDRQIAYATVSLRLVGPGVTHARKHQETQPGGFIGGLTAGWRALVTAVSWLARALGAVLPIGAACALAGYLGYRALRWLQRRGTRPRRA